MGQLTYTTQQVQDKLDAIGTTPRPNLLDNAYFVGGGSQQGGGQFPINQRSSTSYSAAGYTIDRWKTGSSTLTVNSGNITITSTSSSIRGSASHYFENAGKFYGRTLTGSILLSDGSFYYGTATAPSSTPGSQTLVTFSNFNGHTIRVDFGNNGSMCFAILVAASSSLSVQAAKLEIGDTQTLAHWDETTQAWVLNEVPNYQQELAKCQMFFQRLTSSFSPMFYGGVYSDTSANLFIPLPVTMRANPTITPSPIPLDVLTGSGLVSNVTLTTSAIRNRANGIRINGTFGTSLTNGDITAQIREQATTALDLSADL